MSGIKSIVVHVDASAAARQRLRAAALLADQHEAKVTALYAVESLGAVYPFIYVVGSPPDVTLLQEMEERNLAVAARTFEEVAGANDRFQWAAPISDPIRAIGKQAAYADLLIVGQRDPSNPSDACLPRGFVESLLLGPARAALVVPYRGVVRTVGKVALVAWKNTAEAARALAASLPLLRRCDQVHVATWDEDGGRDADSPLDVERYLCLHGIGIRMHRRHRPTTGLGEAVLSLAGDLGADLLVMGCYGHSRAREWVLGGATRTVLGSMTLPVLMAH